MEVMSLIAKEHSKSKTLLPSVVQFINTALLPLLGDISKVLQINTLFASHSAYLLSLLTLFMMSDSPSFYCMTSPADISSS